MDKVRRISNYTKAGYLLISKSVRKGKKKPDYAELAKHGIVKMGPKKHRPNIILEDEICKCPTCIWLGKEYKPKTTRVKNCLDFYMTILRDCDLLDIRNDALSWICRDCVCHDRCRGISDDGISLCKCRNCKHFLDSEVLMK